MTIDAQRLVKISNDLLAAADNSLHNPPDRQYVSPGAPAADCEQLTVHLNTIRNLAPANRAGSGLGATQGCQVLPVGVFIVTLWRCVATVDHDGPPSAEALQVNGEQVAKDAWSLLVGYTELWQASLLVPSVPELDCQAITWQPGVQTLTPQGGLVGITLTVEIQL